jgi:hypothetical protein
LNKRGAVTAEKTQEDGRNESKISVVGERRDTRRPTKTEEAGTMSVTLTKLGRKINLKKKNKR